MNLKIFFTADPPETLVPPVIMTPWKPWFHRRDQSHQALIRLKNNITLLSWVIVGFKPGSGSTGDIMTRGGSGSTGGHDPKKKRMQ